MNTKHTQASEELISAIIGFTLITIIFLLVARLDSLVSY